MLTCAAYLADFNFPDNSIADPLSAFVPEREADLAALLPIGIETSDERPRAMSGETFDFAHAGSLEPTFSQFTALGEDGLEPQPALPMEVSLQEAVDAEQPGQAEASDQPLSILDAMAMAVQRVPEPAPDTVPLPVPRPAEARDLAFQPREAQKVARGPATATTGSLPSTPADNRTLIEKFFGIKPASPPESALGYASLSTGNIAPDGSLAPGPVRSLDALTAVYDISAKVVIMPNGEKLEAHSGLADKLDDPRFVHVRMKGATPPGTYMLREREALFHGVRALRMTPVGGSASIYGRDGILAHTYMLGPNGDSNGCISFKNYDRFLQAYLTGQVKRIVVVLGKGQDALPRVANAR